MREKGGNKGFLEREWVWLTALSVGRQLGDATMARKARKGRKARK